MRRKSVVFATLPHDAWGGCAATFAKFTLELYCASFYYVKLHTVADRPPAACRRPSGPKPEIQNDRRGRGVLTLTWEEVTIKEGNRRCCSCTNKEIISLRLAEEMKQDSPQPMSQERHVLCRILRDPICYSPDPEVVYLTSSERCRIL
jgi:hypothetical protein